MKDCRHKRKRGTGKTSLMAAFASLAENKVLCDADVDAADLHLIMDPAVREHHEFQAGNRRSSAARSARLRCLP